MKKTEIFFSVDAIYKFFELPLLHACFYSILESTMGENTDIFKIIIFFITIFLEINNGSSEKPVKIGNYILLSHFSLKSIN